MSSSGSKKLKQAKGKSVEDAELSQDDHEDSRNERSSSKRKSTNSVGSENGINSKKKRTSNASITSTKSNVSQKSRTSTATKHRYPGAEYSPSEELVAQSKSGATHHTLLSGLLEEVLEQEKNALLSFSESAAAKSIHGKKYIFESVDQVLYELAEDVRRSVTQDIVFEPELAKSERSEIKPLLEAKRLLEEHSQRLEAYEGDVAKLVAEQDLWLGGQLINDKIAALPKSAPSLGESETKAHYQQLLGAMEHHCGLIISSAEATSEVVTRGRQVQDKLYSSFNKARVESAANAKAPRDTKDLLKRMPNLF